MDAIALWQARKASRQTLLYPATWQMESDNRLIPAVPLSGDAVTADFFPHVRCAFSFWGGWSMRTDSTAMKPVIAAALKALQERGGVRLIDPKEGVVTLLQARGRDYATDRSVALLMSILSGLLLMATAGGIVGLSSFWAGQRRKQIGIRRSLGATTSDILRYFHTENFLIVGGGIVLGALLAFFAILGLMKAYELPSMPLYVPRLGALLLWVLGQVAVRGPARYAAKVPPVVAIRSV